MEEHFSTQKLLEQRKLTRAIAELLRNQLRDYLATLAPLFRPAVVLGEYVHGSTKGAAKGAENNFRELKGLYESIAGSRLYALSRELPVPLEMMSTTPEMIAMEYLHVAESGQDRKSITISSPLKWVICYSGYPPAKLRELLNSRVRSNNEVVSFLIHHLVLHIVVAKQPGLIDILQALHFRLVTEQPKDLGGLPLTCIYSAISTLRPPDEVIIESTEISGMDVFEEVVNLEDMKFLQNPLQMRLQELVQKYGITLS
jgi:hypothetical protein